MATFPALKTGAVAQYPAAKSVRFSNQTMRFLDGTEQRYRNSAGPLRRWVIRLDKLDENEMAAIEGFFAANQGAFGSFHFTDPWDGVEHDDCSVESDVMIMHSISEMRGATSLVVRQNRA